MWCVFVPGSTLVVLSVDPDANQQFIEIGRSSSCFITISNKYPRVSRKHARLVMRRNESGEHSLACLDLSTEGTFVDSKLVGKEGLVQLQPEGSRLDLGGYITLVIMRLPFQVVNRALKKKEVARSLKSLGSAVAGPQGEHTCLTQDILQLTPTILKALITNEPVVSPGFFPLVARNVPVTCTDSYVPNGDKRRCDVFRVLRQHTLFHTSRHVPPLKSGSRQHDPSRMVDGAFLLDVCRRVNHMCDVQRCWQVAGRIVSLQSMARNTPLSFTSNPVLFSAFLPSLKSRVSLRSVASDGGWPCAPDGLGDGFGPLHVLFPAWPLMEGCARLAKLSEFTMVDASELDKLMHNQDMRSTEQVSQAAYDVVMRKVQKAVLAATRAGFRGALFGLHAPFNVRPVLGRDVMERIVKGWQDVLTGVYRVLAESCVLADGTRALPQDPPTSPTGWVDFLLRHCWVPDRLFGTVLTACVREGDPAPAGEESSAFAHGPATLEVKGRQKGWHWTGLPVFAVLPVSGRKRGRSSAQTEYQLGGGLRMLEMRSSRCTLMAHGGDRSPDSKDQPEIGTPVSVKQEAKLDEAPTPSVTQPKTHTTSAGVPPKSKATRTEGQPKTKVVSPEPVQGAAEPVIAMNDTPHADMKTVKHPGMVDSEMKSSASDADDSAGASGGLQCKSQSSGALPIQCVLVDVASQDLDDGDSDDEGGSYVQRLEGDSGVRFDIHIAPVEEGFISVKKARKAFKARRVMISREDPKALYMPPPVKTVETTKVEKVNEELLDELFGYSETHKPKKRRAKAGKKK